MSSRKGAEIIVGYPVREGAPYAFGMCGHGDIGLLGALYGRQDEITTISVHQESVAGHARRRHLGLPPLPHPAPSFGWPDEEAVGDLGRPAP